MQQYSKRRSRIWYKTIVGIPTGDNSNYVLYLGLLCFSGILIAVNLRGRNTKKAKL